MFAQNLWAKSRVQNYPCVCLKIVFFTYFPGGQLSLNLYAFPRSQRHFHHSSKKFFEQRKEMTFDTVG